MNDSESTEYLKKVYFSNVCDLYDEAACELHRRSRLGKEKNNRPLFSFMMATYNDDRLLNSAVNSLLRQSFEDWELVILDNSDSNPVIWEILKRLENCDNRVKCIKSEKNVGWPKAAEICLKQLNGFYTSFLSADDCLNINILQYLAKVLIEEAPDILWVGNCYVECNDKENIKILTGVCPSNRIWDETNRSDAIFEIVNNIYYNSFFHYLRVDFLKENNINFFEPYYADCAGMTHAMAMAERMVSVDQIAYFLTMNTSQTVGKYTWNSYDSIFANQWRSIKKVFLREHYEDKEKIYCVVERILRNLIGNIERLCQCSCRDIYMNPIIMSEDEIIGQLEDIFQSEDIVEMIKICDGYFFDNLIATINTSQLAGTRKESFVTPLITMCNKSGNLTLDEKLDCMIQFMLMKENHKCIGLDYFMAVFRNSGKEMQEKYIGKLRHVVAKYKNASSIN